jgi:D-3-phosphoglycerate dehydrogenase
MSANSIFISTAPFCEHDAAPRQILESLEIPYRVNQLGRRLNEQQLIEMLGDATVLIAGTEPINRTVLAASKLRLICRVGTGVDSVDLIEARARGIQVCHTPDAPALAVAELCVGLMLNLLRGVGVADRGVRQGNWRRYSGRRLADSVVGIVGLGRIGQALVRHLHGGFPGVRLLLNDSVRTDVFDSEPQVRWVEREELFRHSDIISLHVPLTAQTRHLVSRQTLSLMKASAYLLNTSRGEVVDEAALAEALQARQLAGAALDVFEHEPYHGPLIENERCLFTCHMGSMTHDCRARMELEAVEDAARFLRGQPLARLVPEAEYQIQLAKG